MMEECSFAWIMVNAGAFKLLQNANTMTAKLVLPDQSKFIMSTLKTTEAWDAFIPISTQEDQQTYYFFHLKLHGVESDTAQIVAQFASDGIDQVGFLLDVYDDLLKEWCVSQVIEFSQSQIKINYL